MFCHMQAALHGAFAFTTLTVVFSEDFETPAVVVHAVGAACCLILLWQVGHDTWFKDETCRCEAGLKHIDE